MLGKGQLFICFSFFALPRQYRHIGEHVFNKDAISRGRVVDEDVGDGTDELAVLNDGGATHSLHDSAREGEKVGVGDGHGEAFGAFGVALDV